MQYPARLFQRPETDGNRHRHQRSGQGTRDLSGRRIMSAASVPTSQDLEKLKVYEKALLSVANLTQCAGAWDKRHSVVDHCHPQHR